MERFTICGLRSFVDYVNETVPKIEGKHFEIQSTNGCHFALWLSGTTCPRDAYAKIASYIVRHNI